MGVCPLAWVNFIAVSYTHLDVYKRQLLIPAIQIPSMLQYPVLYGQIANTGDYTNLQMEAIHFKKSYTSITRPVWPI